MTIADVLRLTPGVKVRIIAFERHTGDRHAEEEINHRGRGIKPAHFFRNKVANYRPSTTHNRMACDVQFRRNHDVRYDIEPEHMAQRKSGHWQPFVNGHLPPNESRKTLIGWQELPLNTKVEQGMTGDGPFPAIGWRGPMMLLEDARKMPLVFLD